jgi:hypothetical protein
MKILKIDGEDFKGTVTPLEAKNLVYLDTLGMDRNNLHGLDITFKGHPVITFRMREQINVDTTFETEDFVYEKETGNGKSIIEGKIRGLRIPVKDQEGKLNTTRWVKLENCQWAFGEEKVVDWLSKYGKLLTPLEEEEHNFGSEDEDDCKDAVGTGNLSAKMTIEKDIPQFLPMLGRKVKIYYRGITKLCINCYKPGHMKKECQNETVGWIDYVEKFKEEHDFPDEMYGNWVRVLNLHKNKKEKASARENLIRDMKNQTTEKQTVAMPIGDQNRNENQGKKGQKITSSEVEKTQKDGSNQSEKGQGNGDATQREGNSGKEKAIPLAKSNRFVMRPRKGSLI